MTDMPRRRFRYGIAFHNSGNDPTMRDSACNHARNSHPQSDAYHLLHDANLLPLKNCLAFHERAAQFEDGPLLLRENLLVPSPLRFRVEERPRPVGFRIVL